MDESIYAEVHLVFRFNEEVKSSEQHELYYSALMEHIRMFAQRHSSLLLDIAEGEDAQQD